MIVVSPYSRKMQNGQPNPKNYPYWNELISLIREYKPEHKFCQPIEGDEPRLFSCHTFMKTNLKILPKTLKDAFLVMAVDNFMPHMAHSYHVNSIVIFSQSDPKLFGYPENLNLLKDEKYLRPNQFEKWEQAVYNEEAFVKPEEVFKQIKSIL